MNEGKLIIFSAPSGAGKTTLVKHLLETDLPLTFSISACTRIPRAGEVDGVDYFFISANEFRRRIDTQLFAEWEEVYTDVFYGTLRSEIDRIWQMGKHVIFDVDVKGGLQLKSIYKENALAIFVMPPSVAALEQRIKDRDTETPESLLKRIDKAHYELGFADQFDYVLINDDLETAKIEAYSVVADFLAS